MYFIWFNSEIFLKIIWILKYYEVEVLEVEVLELEVLWLKISNSSCKISAGISKISVYHCINHQSSRKAAAPLTKNLQIYTPPFLEQQLLNFP